MYNREVSLSKYICTHDTPYYNFPLFDMFWYNFELIEIILFILLLCEIKNAQTIAEAEWGEEDEWEWESEEEAEEPQNNGSNGMKMPTTTNNGNGYTATNGTSNGTTKQSNGTALSNGNNSTTTANGYHINEEDNEIEEVNGKADIKIQGNLLKIERTGPVEWSDDEYEEEEEEYEDEEKEVEEPKTVPPAPPPPPPAPPAPPPPPPMPPGGMSTSILSLAWRNSLLIRYVIVKTFKKNFPRFNISLFSWNA